MFLNQTKLVPIENVTIKHSFTIIYCSCFTIWLRVTKIHYSDPVSRKFTKVHLDHSSWRSGLKTNDFYWFWVSLIINCRSPRLYFLDPGSQVPLIIRVPGLTVLRPAFKIRVSDSDTHLWGIGARVLHMIMINLMSLSLYFGWSCALNPVEKNSC